MQKESNKTSTKCEHNKAVKYL